MARRRKAVDIKDGTYYVYLRKSRKDIERERYGDMETLARHEADLDDVCERDGYPVEGKFKELVSGESIAERKEFQKLMELVSARKVTGVVVHAVDRLGRGSIDEYGWVIATLQRTGTLVITPGKVYDPTDSADYMALIMLMIVASGELAAQKERYRDGRNRSSKSGESISSKAPYGYDKVTVDKQKTLVPNDKADIVRMMYTELANGKMPGPLASEMNRKGIKSSRGKAWAPSVIINMVSNPVYKGVIRWGLTRVEVVEKDGFKSIKRQVVQDPEDVIFAEGMHEPLVSEELWQKANDAIVSSPRTRSDHGLLDPLAGILRCKHCGTCASYVSKKSNPKSKTNRYKHRPYTGCEHVWLPCDADDLLAMVVDSLMELADGLEFSVEKGADDIRRRDEELSALRAELASAERQADKLIDLYTADPPAITINAFRKRNSALTEQMNRLMQSIAELEAKELPDYVKMSMEVRDVAAALKNPRNSAELKNSALKKIIERIEMENHAEVRGHDDVELHIYLKE